MALFPGLPDAKQRADVLVFLRTKNDNPPPLPEAKPEEKPAGRRGDDPRKPGEAGGGDAAFLALIAKADPKQGEADAAFCKVCHTLRQGRHHARRPRSLWRGRTQDRLGRGLQLHARR